MPECIPPPEPDTEDACSEETVQLFGQKPTIYFVLDVSGSMLDYIPEGGDTKLDAAKSALTSVIREIGHRSKYGLATFPGEDGGDDALGCAPGSEVFSVQTGDPIECTNLPPSGPVYTSFTRRLKSIDARGGTPLSPTLGALAPALLAREDQTAVVLITDGAPNCNDEISCLPEDCGPNRYGATLRINGELLACEEEVNCCSPEATGIVDAYLACIDEGASVSHLEDLSRQGIATYVIGVLGSEDFDDVMNALAEAGGRPRDGEKKYYDVESLAELTNVVRTIGRDVTQTCTIELVEPPIFPDQFNLYFDGEVVPQDPENGWTLDEGTLTLQGDACQVMESGAVDEVQLLAGCQTVVR